MNARELAREAAAMERARYNHALPRPTDTPTDTELEQATRRTVMLREFNTWRDRPHLKAVS